MLKTTKMKITQVIYGMKKIFINLRISENNKKNIGLAKKFFQFIKHNR